MNDFQKDLKVIEDKIEELELDIIITELKVQHFKVLLKRMFVKKRELLKRYSLRL